MSEDNKPSIFKKISEAAGAVLDSTIQKAQSASVMNQNLDDDFYYAKTLTEDPSYAIHAQGWKENPHRLQNGHLKSMASKNTVVAAILQTRQNQISNYTKLVKADSEKGWKLVLKNEEELLEKIKEELRAETEAEYIEKSRLLKSEFETEGTELEADDAQDKADNQKSDDQVEIQEWELERKAKQKLEKKFAAQKKKAEQYLLNCGSNENRPFETKKWNFDTAIRAMVKDRLTYALFACEMVPNKTRTVHHWYPIDASTVKFASNQLDKYRETAENFSNLDILYPEKQVKDIENAKILELDEDLLSKNLYKFVQVIRGKVERAYTTDELKVHVGNPTTDIYNNGYGVSELELAVSLITGHLNAEYYNQSYFTQGFSAKGILHIKAAINRRKLESIRQRWQHMLKGAKNSFQTPIFAGVDDVEWIPLTQNHNDIGFEGWMRYLIKMICAIYQIDPQEIGISLQDEGGTGFGKNDTKDKIDQSKDKGLFPLLREFETYINDDILRPFDDRFEFKFCGITEESEAEKFERVEKSLRIKTVNEIREEFGLRPLPGLDSVMLTNEFLQWLSNHSPEAKAERDANLQLQADQAKQNKEDEVTNSDLNYVRDQEAAAIEADRAERALQIQNDMQKSIKIKVETYETKD